jgi:hypothetical protein
MGVCVFKGKGGFTLTRAMWAVMRITVSMAAEISLVVEGMMAVWLCVSK